MLNIAVVILAVAIATTQICSSVSAAQPYVAKDTVITVNVYGGTVRNVPFEADQANKYVTGGKCNFEVLVFQEIAA